MAWKEEIENFAVQTLNWMKDLGAVHDYEKRTRSTVTVEDWAKHFLVALDDEGELTIKSYQMWQHVKLEMINQGMAIAISPKGHYLGKKGDQASNVIYNIIHGLSRIGRATLQLEAIKDSGRDQYVEARKFMRGKINPDRVIGLIEATKGVSPQPQYNITPSDDLLLLVEEVEEEQEDML